MNPPQALAPTFANVEKILNQSCAFATCHGSTNSNPIGGPLSLTTGASYGALLGNPPFTGRPSFQMPQLKLVNPGKPDSSYLSLKLKGFGQGSRMPFFGDPLPAETIALIDAWIAAGALRN